MGVLEYYVMRADGGHTMWLTEGQWTECFHDATAFRTAEVAYLAANARLSDDQVFYVMGCMESE